MKIAIITSTFPPYAGGIGNVAANNARELKKLGNQVTVFTPLYKTVTEETTDLDVKRIKPFIKYGNAAFLPQLVGLLRGYDVVHLHYPFFGGAEVIWLNSKKIKKRGTKIILHYHMDVVGSGFLKSFFSVHTKFILPKIINCADRVVLTSLDYGRNSNLKQQIEKSPEKFLEVPNGVDIDFFKPLQKDQAMLNQLQIKSAEKIVLFVGGLDKAHYFKGIEYLIQAVSRLKEMPYLWRLIVVGDGDMKKDYVDLAGQFNVSSRIIFAGYVKNHELPEYYNLADVVVLPSIDKSEAFGLALVEAMACAKPTIASNLPGVRSVLKDEVTGFLVEPTNVDQLASRINFFLKQPELSYQFGQAGLQKVQSKYSWQKIGMQLNNLYLSLKNEK